MTLVPRFISPFCTVMTDDGVREPMVEREPIVMGGCLTDEDERPLYTEEEWRRRKGLK